MEVLIDFGLFEFIAVTGTAYVSRRIYAHRILGLAFLAASIAAPLSLTFLCRTATTRCLAACCLALCVVNAGAIVAMMQAGNIPQLRMPARFQEIATRLKGSIASASKTLK